MILVIIEAKIMIACDSQEDYSDSSDSYDSTFIGDSKLDCNAF